MTRFLDTCILVALITMGTHAQSTAGSNRVLSPTTVAYWQQHDDGDGSSSLDVLVLWRGNPGWFLRGAVVQAVAMAEATSAIGKRLTG